MNDNRILYSNVAMMIACVILGILLTHELANLGVPGQTQNRIRFLYASCVLVQLLAYASGRAVKLSQNGDKDQ